MTQEQAKRLQNLQTNVLMMYAAGQLQLYCMDVLKGTQFYNQSKKNLINNLTKLLEREMNDFYIRYIQTDNGIEIIEGQEYSKAVAFNTVQELVDICVKQLSSLRPGEVPQFAAIMASWRDVKEVTDETYQAL